MNFSYLNTMLLASTGTWLDFVHPIAVIVLAIGSIVSATFAIRAYNRTQQSREYQNYLEFKKPVNQANIYYLANPEDLQFINGWLYDRDNDAVAARDRFNFFILLNVLEAAFLSRRYGADEIYLDMKLSHLLGRLFFSYTDKDGNLQTRDPIYNALYYGGYDPRFIQHCRSKSREFESWVQEQESMEQRNTRPRGE